MNLPPFQLERYFARYEFQARYLLGSSDCETLSVGELLALEQEAEEKLRGLRLGYTESAGSPALRREICGLYEKVDPEQVLVHTGAEEAIFLFMQAVLRPGDRIIVHWPCYSSLAEVAAGLGCQVIPWAGREEDGWAPDPNELRRLLRGGARVVVINSPHNPTGYHFPGPLFREIVRITGETTSAWASAGRTCPRPCPSWRSSWTAAPAERLLSLH